MLKRYLDKLQNVALPKPQDQKEGRKRIGSGPRTSLYLIVSLIVFSLISMLTIGMGMLDLSDKEKELFVKVIGEGTVMLGILFLLLRQDSHNRYVHDREHEQDSKYQAIMSSTNIVEKKTDKAAIKAEEAVQVAKEFRDEIKEKLNGGLHETVKEEVKQQFEQSPFPTNEKQLREFVKATSDCTEAVERGSKKALEEYTQHLINLGILPEHNKDRTTT